MELHLRGSQQEFDLAKELTSSNDPVSRVIGADILGQLGCSLRHFHDESVEILIQLLSDVNDDVIASAAFSLGHRNHAKAIPTLIKLLHHTNPRIRYGVAFGLSCLEDVDAIRGLITLSYDQDEDTRNWATFGLGSQCEMDFPEIRKALHDRVSDLIPEIRGEAMIGLAERKDESIIPILQQELDSEFYGSWAIKAAALLASPLLCPSLQRLKLRFHHDLDGCFIAEIDDAILTCCSPSTKK
ncbi:HEAT repeat domain-containing protein [Acinetobacter defluvii]|uniref:HEAT repeat domain-containing protein n=1 Tax=Acinetobacter defluvii TaxID=1871111 RepID=UPI003AF9EF35